MDIQPETQGSKDVFKGKASSIEVHGPHIMFIILKPLLFLPASSPNPITGKMKAMMHHLLQTWPIFQVLSLSGSCGTGTGALGLLENILSRQHTLASRQHILAKIAPAPLSAPPTHVGTSKL